MLFKGGINMYKKVGIILISAILILGGIGSYARERVVLENTKTNYKTIGSSLAMMYEIKAESGEYQAVNDSVWPQDGYIFNENLSKCENGGKLSWDNTKNKVIMEGNTSDKCYVYFDKIPVIADRCTNENMATCMILNYKLDENLYYHDSNLTNGANDNSYRYSGANPNNYVCFGIGEGSCPEDNLYRIIGIFDGKIKLVKYTTYTYAYWGGTNTNSDNNWINSTLNTEILNGEFLSSWDSSWQDKIVDTSWHIDGINNGVKGQTAAGVYDYEIRNATTLYNARIGLMYISDYGFGVTPDYWNLPISNYNTNEVTSNNWLYENTIQWTISKQNDSASHAYFVDGMGTIFGDTITIYNGSVKPVFYLNSAVILTSGTGTLDDPYRINA